LVKKGKRKERRRLRIVL